MSEKEKQYGKDPIDEMLDQQKIREQEDPRYYKELLQQGLTVDQIRELIKQGLTINQIKERLGL